jgi:hypothetical protein
MPFFGGNLRLSGMFKIADLVIEGEAGLRPGNACCGQNKKYYDP